MAGEQEVAGNGGGRGDLRGWRWMDPEGRECKILQPRGTHGDVISTTEPETYYNPAVRQPRSHSVSMYEWPILLGLSLGKSIYSDYRPPPLAHPLAAQLTRAACVFLSSLSHPSPTYTSRVCGTKIPFFASTGDQDDGFRNRAAEERFLHCRFLSL